MLVRAKVDFNRKVLDWDGFGFNYVETAQTKDYTTDPQDYGGFSILSKEKQEEILQLVFGKNGLRPSVIKLFLDPFHQTHEKENGTNISDIDPVNYDHVTYTKQMLFFVKRGMELAKEQKQELSFLTTLYGPPAFMTKQKTLRGLNLDENYKLELAKYIVSWAEFLRKEMEIPVTYLSIHNEGEDYHRWPYDGSSANLGTGHDYNMYWPPELVAEMMPLIQSVIQARGDKNLFVTPGETSSWNRFDSWGYADAIINNEEALNAIGLITSHGFISGLPGDAFYGDFRSAGIDKIKEKRPKLHVWTTSTTWGQMDASFIYNLHELIYSTKSNAVIPWAGIQRPTLWVGGDPNPGNAILIKEDGTYQIRDGYYYYKQVCPVGQAGMYVAQASAAHSQACVFAFAKNTTKHPNAFVVVNASNQEAEFKIEVVGQNGKSYSATRTAAPMEYGKDMGTYQVDGGTIAYMAPANSVTTFIEREGC